MRHVRKQTWQEHYDAGLGFRPLSDAEQALLAEHVPAPEGGRALDVGSGTGELAVVLARMGYHVDAVDCTEGALVRARAEHPGAQGVRWLCLDIEHDVLPSPPEGAEGGYDLVTMRLSAAFIQSRSRVLRALGAQLREGGALVIITPVVEHTPQERRHIALDEDELSQITDGFEEASRFDAQGLAVLVLRGPGGSFTAVEKGRPAPQAVMGAAAVVTNAAGHVLLGRSTRGMWELPGGRIEAGESAQTAAVRELEEETGLTASEKNAHIIAVLHDDRLDIRRISPLVRVTCWEGEPGLPEPEKFSRWEWHPLHTLATLGKIFMPSAQALNEVWPGTLPGLPPVHSYPCATTVPPVPGEPAEAALLRARMADAVVAKGWAQCPRVEAALREVPRHRFLPEAPLEQAYDDSLAVVTVREPSGSALSSVSAVRLQAGMIESLQLEPGAAVYEAGSGGYNAELLAHVVGPGGQVVTSDIDEYVVRRARRFTAEAGSGRVSVVHGDAAHGAPAHLVPRGGFDAIMVTYSCWDIAPVWKEQLAEGGRLVLPLELGGYTRAITFQKQGDVLLARRFTHCGFVPAQGMHARSTPTVSLLDGRLRIRFEDGPAPGMEGLEEWLEEALRGRRYEIATGVTTGPGSSFDSLQLYLATTVPGFCRLAIPAGQETSAVLITPGSNAPAVLGDASLAYLTYVQIRPGEAGEEQEWEWYVHAFGDQGPAVGEKLADTVRAWDRDVRGDDRRNADPAVTVHPAKTPDHRLPSGDVVDKPHCRIVVRWPGRDALLPSSTNRAEAHAVATGGSM
ncbi:methyltransferase, FxLD system [Streptomyces sp. NPDC002669]|uniref:methyltransferase, FxLD system n=1 Tax=Streptomyces sp. NPDC002669 TaxID=3364658 RepID=UPI0036BF1D0C